MSTLTDKDRVILESLDFEPPCSSRIEIHPEGRPPAKWVAFLTARPCGCAGSKAMPICSECKDFYLTHRDLACPRCGTCYLTTERVLRIEPLR